MLTMENSNMPRVTAMMRIAVTTVMLKKGMTQ